MTAQLGLMLLLHAHPRCALPPLHSGDSAAPGGRCAADQNKRLRTSSSDPWLFTGGNASPAMLTGLQNGNEVLAA
ncbi:hypothetical protein PAMP_011810 [Pampus punctatissimus]